MLCISCFCLTELSKTLSILREYMSFDLKRERNVAAGLDWPNLGDQVQDTPFRGYQSFLQERPLQHLL